jgi:photosystem II stability/assembly factor-like uncharacterized protein
MKIYFVVILMMSLFLQACKKNDNINNSTIEKEEDFWEFTSQPDKIIRSIKMCSNGYMIAETPGKILLSTDNGKNWNGILSADTEGPVGIGPQDEIYIAGNSEIWFSFDYGNSWNRKTIKYIYTDSNEYYVTIYCIRADKKGSIYIGTSGGVFRSDDRAFNWKRLVNGMVIEDIRSMLVSSSNKIFAEANSNINGIYSSTDKGEIWQDLNTKEMEGELFSVLAEDSLGNLYAGGIHKLLKSIDNGNSWQIITAPGTFFTDILIDKNNNFYASFADGGMFFSKDGGSTWEEKSKGLKGLDGIRSLLLTKDGYLFAGTDGMGIYKSKKPVY